MAIIDSLHTSITDMPEDGVFNLLHKIRANRRLRPAARKKAPAKVARAPNKKAPKQQDLFALAIGMSSDRKAALAAQLIKEMKK